VNKEMHIEFPRLLRGAVRSKAPRSGDPTIGYSTRRSSTPVGFGPRYLNKGQWDNTGVSSMLS